MPKKRYRYNPKTLMYEEVKVSFRKRLFRILSHLFTGATFTFVVLLIAYSFFESPKELMQRREIEQLTLQYNVLNDRISQMEDVLADLQEKDDNIYRVIFEAEPVSPSIRKAGYGGANKYAKLDGYQNSDVIIETTRRIDQLANQLYVQSKSFDDVFDMAKNKAEMLSCLPAIQPMKNENLRRISSYYGYRIDPFYKIKKFHQGVDFSAPYGTEIYATGDGVVTTVKRSRRGYGNEIIIDHGYGYETRYAHLQEFKVRRGEKVSRGQVIGLVGNTGKSTAPHLHYEVIKDNKTVNPIYYFFNDLSPEQFDRMLDLSAIPTQSMD
jgi:murein DD-endopeptidase MepM/ murein hydrolase activator NlpD